VRSDRVARAPEVLVGIGSPQFVCIGDRQSGGDVARERVVRRRLVGDEVEVLPTASQLGHDFGRVSEQPDRERPPLGRRRPHALQRVVERICRLVQVPRLQPSADAPRVDLDAEDRRAGHRRCERLRSAHAAEARGQNRPAAEVC